MKRLLLTVSIGISALYGQSQVSFDAVTTHNSCFGDSIGEISIDNIRGCYAPISMGHNGDTFVFDNLKNDGYNGLIQGAGTSTQQGTGVAAAQTSVGDVFVVAGYFEDSITLGNTTIHEAVGAGGSGWLGCFDASNNATLWAIPITGGGSSYCAAYSAEIVGDKAYAVGYFNGTVQFGNTNVVSGGGYQGFIVKVDIPSGSVDTVVQLGNAGTDETTNIRYGDDGRLYISGDFTGSIQLAGNTLAASASYDLFLTCFDTALTNNYWAISAGGSSFDVARDIVPHTSNGVVDYVYTTGYYYGSANFGGTSLTSASGQDIFIAKADTAGNWIWAKSANGSGTNDAFSLDLSPNGDKVYVGGVFQNTLTYDGQSLTSAGNNDGFIAYTDSAGNILDAFQMGNSGPDAVYDLDVVEEDYLVFAGEFAISLNFADSTFIPNGGSGSDAFTGKLGPDLNEIWGKNFGANGGFTENFNSVAVGDNDYLHCTGIFTGNASAFQAGLISQGSDAIITNERLSGLVDTVLLFDGLTAGEYIVEVSDSNENAFVDTIEILQPSKITTSAIVTDESYPTAGDGSIDLSVTGGTPPYTFIWSNLATTEDISDLNTGDYGVTVTDSNGCMVTDSFFVDFNLPILLTLDISDKTCQDDNNGSIDLSVNNGVLPLSYLWNTGDTTQDLTDLSAGAYSVTVTDATLATATASGTVADNPIHPNPEVGPITGTISADWWTEYTYTVPSTGGSQFTWGAIGGDVVSMTGNTSVVEWRAGPDGFVHVTEIDINGCSAADTLVVSILPAGVEEVNARYLIYPNPTDNAVIIELGDAYAGSRLNLFDLSGQRVANAKTVGLKSTIDVSDLPAGIYILRIKKDATILTEKIVVE
ncbi:MAG: hypothetical protein Salg2KO_04720 [Salibacteraceae bacterium]